MYVPICLRQIHRRWFVPRHVSAWSGQRSPPARRSVRPRLEWLEDRITPTTFTPTVLTDGTTGGTLREAILSANADTGTATDTIQLKAGTYKLTIPNTANNHDVSGTQGDLNITSTNHNLIIQGVTDASGKPLSIIDQTVADRVFQIVNPGTTVTFKNLIIEGGTARENGGAGTAAGDTEALGGGILDDGGNVTLSNVVLRSNQAKGGSEKPASGGGIYVINGSLTITNSVIQDNLASGGAGTSTSPDGVVAYGGGIAISSTNAAQLRITRSTVSGNDAFGGNGYSTGNGNGGNAEGGGIYAFSYSTYTLPVVITASTVWLNTAGGGIGSGTGDAGLAQGGGVWFSGSSAASTFKLVNSTIVGNIAGAGPGNEPSINTIDAAGGGLYFPGGAATLTNVTVAKNTASKPSGNSGFTNGGGIDVGISATVTLVNTLVALNHADGGADYFGSVSNSNHNLIGDILGSSGFSTAHGDLWGNSTNPLNPQLGPLANNGGPTRTLAVLPGSPAINTGDNSAQAVTGPTDQRGSPRVASGTIDIGAFEFQPPPPSPPPNPPPSPPVPSLFQAILSLYIAEVEKDIGFGDPAALQQIIDFNAQYTVIFGINLAPFIEAIADANVAAARGG